MKPTIALTLAIFLLLKDNQPIIILTTEFQKSADVKRALQYFVYIALVLLLVLGQESVFAESVYCLKSGMESSQPACCKSNHCPHCKHNASQQHVFQHSNCQSQEGQWDMVQDSSPKFQWSRVFVALEHVYYSDLKSSEKQLWREQNSLFCPDRSDTYLERKHLLL